MATFKVIQDGIVVASGSSSDESALRTEALHYGIMYSQDGPVKVMFNGKEIATMTNCTEFTTENHC